MNECFTLFMLLRCAHAHRHVMFVCHAPSDNNYEIPPVAVITHTRRFAAFYWSGADMCWESE